MMSFASRIVKLGISSLCWTADSVGAAAARFLRRRGSARATVLYYHAINADERGRFAAQMDALIRCAAPVSAADEGALEPGRRYAAVTFDDGFASVVEHALPELEARRIPMTFFIPTGCWGQRPSWVKNPCARAYRQRLLTPDELQMIATHPLVTFGAHSATHPDFLTLDEDRARRELQVPKAELERILGREVAVFSFPHGRCDTGLVDMARAAGYRRVFTISPSWAFRTPGEFVTGRIAVEPADWPAEFWLKVRGAYRWQSLFNSGA